MNAGIGNPQRDLAIALGGCALGLGLLGGGVWAMEEAPDAAWPHVAVAVGLLLTILFPLFALNFFWAVRRTNAMRRGENVIARWIVPQQTLEEFRDDEAARKTQGRRNDWKVPRRIPPEGVEVIFSKDAVMIGKSFFGLSKAGLARFTHIQMVPGNPLAIGFGMALTTGRATSGGAVLTTYRSELRIPIARTANAEASKVMAHYTSVDRGQTIAKPGFWTLRVRMGQWAMGIGATSAALGFGLNAIKVDWGLAPLVMAVVGAVVALAGVVLAGIAGLMRRRETEDRQGRR